jgi:hypothetical protein
VVFVPHNADNREHAGSRTDFTSQVIIVGDARSPRYLRSAIRAGHPVARLIQ